MNSVKTRPNIPEINWGKVQLLQSIKTKLIVLSDGTYHKGGCFAGTVVFRCDNNDHQIGYYAVNWAKELFEVFDGTIQLSND